MRTRHPRLHLYRRAKNRLPRHRRRRVIHRQLHHRHRRRAIHPRLHHRHRRRAIHRRLHHRHRRRAIHPRLHHRHHRRAIHRHRRGMLRCSNHAVADHPYRTNLPAILLLRRLNNPSRRRMRRLHPMRRLRSNPLGQVDSLLKRLLPNVKRKREKSSACRSSLFSFFLLQVC